MNLSIRSTVSGLCASACCGAVLASPAEPLTASRVYEPVRVMTLVMAASEKEPGDWRGEVERWTSGGALARRVAVPGLIQPVLCGESGHCLAILGEGPIAAAASVMALGLYPGFDLTKTYFLVAGIAGTSPQMATLGSVAWVDWVVDADSVAEIDRRELPEAWQVNRFRKWCGEPWCDNSWGVSAYPLNPALVERAVALSRSVALQDSEKAQAYRSLYPDGLPARRPPSVLKCSSLAGGTYWHGTRMSDWAQWWVDRWTSGHGRYCMTNEEDFAILAGLERLSTARLVDRDRVLVIRAASNFDQPHAGQSALESLNQPLEVPNDGYRLAIENVHRVGRVVVENILQHWRDWEKGVPRVTAQHLPVPRAATLATAFTVRVSSNSARAQSPPAPVKGE